MCSLMFLLPLLINTFHFMEASESEGLGFAGTPEVHLRKSRNDAPVELLTWGKEGIHKHIHLSTYGPHYSVAVLIVNDIPWTEEQLPPLSGELTVHSPSSSHGIMGVIQILYLRRNQTFPTEECVDFIHFYDPISALGSPKICGKLRKETRLLKPEGLIGSRVFNSPSGLIQVGYKSGGGDPTYPVDKNYDLSFHMMEIVFTAYSKGCSQDQDPGLSPCGLQDRKCISSSLLCDERINCGDPDDFGSDEKGCSSLHGGDENNNDKPKSWIIAVIRSLQLTMCLALLAGIAGFILVFYRHIKTYQKIRLIPNTG